MKQQTKTMTTFAKKYDQLIYLARWAKHFTRRKLMNSSRTCKLRVGEAFPPFPIPPDPQEMMRRGKHEEENTRLIFRRTSRSRKGTATRKKQKCSLDGVTGSTMDTVAETCNGCWSKLFFLPSKCVCACIVTCMMTCTTLALGGKNEKGGRKV